MHEALKLKCTNNSTSLGFPIKVLIRRGAHLSDPHNLSADEQHQLDTLIAEIQRENSSLTNGLANQSDPFLYTADLSKVAFSVETTKDWFVRLDTKACDNISRFFAQPGNYIPLKTKEQFNNLSSDQQSFYKGITKLLHNIENISSQDLQDHPKHKELQDNLAKYRRPIEERTLFYKKEDALLADGASTVFKAFLNNRPLGAVMSIDGLREQILEDVEKGRSREVNTTQTPTNPLHNAQQVGFADQVIEHRGQAVSRRGSWCSIS